ncbi:MAG: hypothetical protein QW279_10240 [Candidatus Jordarchaeaceae archaeon]
MVKMAAFLTSIGAFEQITFLTIAITHAICAVYLFRRYLINRENLTLLFVSFFGVMPVFWFVNFLVAAGILDLNLTVTLEYTYLIGATFLAVIGLVLLGIKHIYALPPLLVILAYIQQTQMDSRISETTNLIQVIFLYFTGHFLGDPWFISLKIVYPNLFLTGQQIVTILNYLYDPLARSPIMILGIYLPLIIFPTTILFYILAWKNRSGRSLGFALGLTTFILIGILTASLTSAPRDLYNVLTLVASAFFILGILGVLDKIIKRESSKRQVKK